MCLGFVWRHDIGMTVGMRAAHVLWEVAQAIAKDEKKTSLSIVVIPKTMDNDILWVRQTFGFLQAGYTNSSWKMRSINTTTIINSCFTIT
jgi:6-phosphofructokinase